MEVDHDTRQPPLQTPAVVGFPLRGAAQLALTVIATTGKPTRLKAYLAAVIAMGLLPSAPCRATCGSVTWRRGTIRADWFRASTRLPADNRLELSRRMVPAARR